MSATLRTQYLTQNAFDKTNTMPKFKLCKEYTIICRCYSHMV